MFMIHLMMTLVAGPRLTILRYTMKSEVSAGASNTVKQLNPQ